ncbi:hypothetical protein BCR35DRAFT_287397 [Leucosporidium creatinivorum]|uniref:NmrA-like domain-containing protein n=1 Tax=Leucosporidium creatinivorum TaxID=106004 RepID=A0A1Y2G0J4_9BASI|nr:hypothetical protein BCR35DRAFT_287397 [Leucosporidium creatinivorum]
MPVLPPVLVVGATGQQGSAVVRALQALPQPPQIKVISRNPSSPSAQKLKEQGIEVVKGDLSDIGSLETALQGVGSAFLVTTISGKNGPTEDQMGKNFVTAAQRTSLPFLVFSSVSDATPTCGIPHFETKAKVEEALKASGLRHAVVAPVAFADNFPKQSGFSLTMVLGLFEAALKGKKLQVVAVSDIGYVAAEAFNNPERYAGRHIKLAGDSLTMSEIRDIYSRVEKKGVWKGWLPSPVISLLPYDFKMMMRMFGEKGYTADIEALRKEFPKLHTYEQWLRSTKDA